MGAFRDLAGQTFGRLTVVSRAENSDRGCVRWVCLCECGNDKIVLGGDLTSGDTSSCGCLNREQSSVRRLNDLTGRVFGGLRVLSRAENDKSGRNARWICLCECGADRVVLGQSLTRGLTTSCGCRRRKLVSERRLNDLTGKVFGRLTALHRAENSKGRKARWLCHCECGTERIVWGRSLVTGNATSCGCLAKEHPGGYNRTRLERGDFLESNTSSFLYVMQVGDLVKVGVSNNPPKRSIMIRRQSKLPVEVLATYKGSLHDVVSWEIASHEALRDHKTSSPAHFGGHTELFSLPIEHVKQTVENICKQ